LPTGELDSKNNCHQLLTIGEPNSQLMGKTRNLNCSATAILIYWTIL